MFVRAIGISLSVLSFAACQNYTTQPLCNGENAVAPPGLSGVYALSMQADDFSAVTQKFAIGFDKSGKSLKITSDDKVTDEGRICSVNGFLISESMDDASKLYSQQRLYVTGMGITLTPLFFNKTKLDQAGIPSKVTNIPAHTHKAMLERHAAIFGHAAQRFAKFMDDESPGLVIDNADYRSDLVLGSSLAAPVGLTYLRQ